MVASLKALLQEAIDYAGLFPPAALPIEEAAKEYTDIMAGPNAWLVSRFVCPVAWLSELHPLLPDGAEPWLITALGTSLEGFRQDMNLVERFESLAQGKAVVDAYEVKGSKEEMTPSSLNKLNDDRFSEVFVEIPWRTGLAESLHPLVNAEGIGVKARTGGLEADMFPSNEELAAFIHECVSLDIPFKLTAGLHHPFPKVDPATGARMHGFLNVLVATAFSGPLDLTRAEITQILAEDNPDQFMFHDAGVRFGHWGLDLEELDFGRLMLSSWGSCSVQEPLDDLATAKLFP